MKHFSARRSEYVQYNACEFMTHSRLWDWCVRDELYVSIARCQDEAPSCQRWQDRVGTSSWRRWRPGLVVCPITMVQEGTNSSWRIFFRRQSASISLLILTFGPSLNEGEQMCDIRNFAFWFRCRTQNPRVHPRLLHYPYNVRHSQHFQKCCGILTHDTPFDRPSVFSERLLHTLGACSSHNLKTWVYVIPKLTGDLIVCRHGFNASQIYFLWRLPTFIEGLVPRLNLRPEHNFLTVGLP